LISKTHLIEDRLVTVGISFAIDVEEPFRDGCDGWCGGRRGGGGGAAVVVGRNREAVEVGGYDLCD